MDGKRFTLVCVRGTGVAVYRGDGAYLRLGDGDAVAGELDVHRRMLLDGYPVADILEVGHRNGLQFYIEKALGDDTWGDAWADRVAHGDAVADEEFAGFLAIMRRHARAELAGGNRSCDAQEFAEFIGVDRAAGHTPELSAPIHAAWEAAMVVLSGLPGALQHGDLHPFNVCPDGIIDLEGAGWAPAGYDVATAVFQPTLAEPRWQSGALALGWFTPGQVRTYLDVLDEEFQRFDLPVPSTQIHAHLVCRAINLGSRLHRNSAIREARQLMLAKVLQAFLDSGRLPLDLGGDLLRDGRGTPPPS